MTQRQNQCARVLNYIDKHGSISRAVASALRVARLASRIFDLRTYGYPIIGETVSYKDDDGFIVHFSVKFEEAETDGDLPF